MVFLILRDEIGGRIIVLPLFREHYDRIKENTTVIHYADMNAWERALKSAARKHDHVQIIGLQHAIVSLLHLFYFNGLRDLKEGSGVQKIAPAALSGVCRENFLETTS